MRLSNINIEERSTAARELFTKGYNCSQSVAMAYADIFNEVDPQTILAITSSFGGGMGRLREVCGAVSGMATIAGLALPATDPKDRGVKGENYALVQRLATSFRQSNGSIICRELLQGAIPQKESTTPSERTEEYYKKRPCAELVAEAARILGEELLALRDGQ